MEKQDNKYLTFELKEEKYGIHIKKVREIIGMKHITSVPNIPEFVRGVINLRGKIISVIDLRLKLGINKKDYNERTSIIVIERQVQGGILTSGIIVDSVNDVQDISQENIEPPPSYGETTYKTFLKGLGKIKDEVIMLIDEDNIFSFEKSSEN